MSSNKGIKIHIVTSLIDLTSSTIGYGQICIRCKDEVCLESEVSRKRANDRGVGADVVGAVIPYGMDECISSLIPPTSSQFPCRTKTPSAFYHLWLSFHHAPSPKPRLAIASQKRVLLFIL